MRIAAAAVACLWVLALLGGGRPAIGAGPRLAPLPSPAPGSPVFTSFSNRFEDSLSSTLFDVVAQGTGLAYVWSLQNVTCGSLGLPQGRDPKNSYVHPSCAVSGEILVRVTVLVAKTGDINADGTVRGPDAAYFIYSQIARANDGDPATANVPPAPQLQYFGPTPALPTTTSRPVTTAPAASAGTGGTTTDGGFPWWVLILVALAGLGGFFLWTQQKKPAKPKDPCDEERRRVAAAKAALDAARARQQRINQLKAANDKAQTDLTNAQREMAAATDPKTVSWAEDSTGKRVYTNKAQAARVDRATAGLTAAQTAAAAAKSAWEGAGNGGEVQQANYAVEDAMRHLGQAEEALARCLQTNVPPPPPPPPPPGGGTTTTGGGGPTVAIGGGPTTQARKTPKCPPGTFRDAPTQPRAPLRVSLTDMSSVLPKCFSSDDREIPWDDINGAMAYAKNARKALSWAGGKVGKISEEAESAMSPMGPILSFTGTMTDKALEGLQQVIDIYKKKAGSGFYGVTFTVEDFELRCIARQQCVDDEWVSAPSRFEIVSLGAHEARRGGSDERDHVQVVYGSTDTLANQVGRILQRYVNSLKGQNDGAVRQMKDYETACGR